MTDEGTRNVRSAIEGAGRAFQVIEGGGGGPPKPPEDRSPPDKLPCPLTCLGHLDGHFHFLDARGQKRQLGARALGNRHELLALFLGSDAWLRQEFPKKAKVKRQENGEEIEVEVVVDFAINNAAKWLQRECGEQGLYGEHVVLRAPGVWPGENGFPVVHCGDAILIDGFWKPAGGRNTDQVWSAAAPMRRPALPCDASVARTIQADLKELWNFRKPGGEIAALGLLCSGYYGASIRWRPAGFLLGGVGSGKSALLRVLKSASPMHHYSNDTSKAGIEGAINGRAMPIFVDETSDRAGGNDGARALLDMVLSASGGDGTRGVRGSPDGQVRTFQIAGSIVYAAVNPPDMQPQHLGRFTLIETGKPDSGADHTEQHIALQNRCVEVGPALWGRALAGAQRYGKALSVFRRALSEVGCLPREMDQIGALLAGWWILTEESVPNERDAQAGVSALGAFIRDSDEVISEDGPQRMVHRLTSSLVTMTRSTERKQIGVLMKTALQKSYGPDSFDGVETARNVLADYGIRVIRADDTAISKKGTSAPRAADGNGVWFNPAAVELAKLFRDSPWDGGRWVYELKRLESARQPQKPLVRIGALVGRCIWVSAEELGVDPMED